MRAPVLAVVAAAASCAWPAPPPSTDSPAVPAAPPRSVLLQERMQLHADEHAALRHAIASRDFPRAAEVARAILAQPSFAAVGSNLDGDLPERFVLLHERMMDATRAVETAALACDPEQLDVAFRALTATCGSCHAVYRAHRGRR